MDKKFVDILCCPETRSNLELQIAETFPNGMIKSGVLLSKAANTRYPIIAGVPRFVKQESYAGSFGFEWKKWARVQFDDDNIGRPMAGHTTKMFFKITDFAPEEIKNKYVIEFGCGPGRFLDVVRKHGGIAIGIDMSGAVEPARQNFQDDPDTLIVQGDIGHPPFKPNTFDLGYSIGVLHHTPEPVKGLLQLIKVLKPGAKAACCVYPKAGWYAYPVLTRLLRSARNDSLCVKEFQ